MPVVKGKSGTHAKRMSSKPLAPAPEPASTYGEETALSPAEAPAIAPGQTRPVKPIVLLDDSGKKIVLGVYSDGRFSIGRQGKSEEKEAKPGRAPIVVTGKSGRKIGFGVWPDGTLVVAMGSYPQKTIASQQPGAKKETKQVAREEWDESMEPTIMDKPTTSHGGIRAPVRGWKAVPIKKETASISTVVARGKGTGRDAHPLSPDSLRQIRKARRSPSKDDDL